MTGTGPEAPADPDLSVLADRLLELVAPGVEAAVTVSDERHGLTRFANSFIHQHVGEQQLSVGLQVASGGRTASATTTDASQDGLARLVTGALRAAALRPPDPDWPGLAPPEAPLANPEGHADRATALAGPAERAEVVASFVAAGDGLAAAGYCETRATRSLLANSRGQRIFSSATRATIDGIHRAGQADGCGLGMSSRLGDLDGERAGRTAAETARASTETIELPPGHYEVVLEPRPVAYLLDFFAVYGFNAKAVEEGQSFVSVGEVQFDPALSIWDDATDGRHVGLAFDAEGTPKRRVELVRAGRSVGVTHDRRTAARAGGTAISTGHAIPGGASRGPLATNLFLSGATTVPVESLIRHVERGLLVKDFWYTRVLDPRTLVVTGLTRNGVFLIDHGAIGPAVSNLRFTQSPAAAFAPGHVLGVGDDATLAPGGLHQAWHHVPSLHLAAWNFTGNASG